MCDNGTLNKILDLTKVKMQEIFKENLISVILFGSYARGENKSESDLDIMVLIDMDKLELLQYKKIVSKFANTLDLEYDVLVSIKLQDKETFERWENTLPFFKNIKKEGVVIGA